MGNIIFLLLPSLPVTWRIQSNFTYEMGWQLEHYQNIITLKIQQSCACMASKPVEEPTCSLNYRTKHVIWLYLPEQLIQVLIHRNIHRIISGTLNTYNCWESMKIHRTGDTRVVFRLLILIFILQDFQTEVGDWHFISIVVLLLRLM